MKKLFILGIVSLFAALALPSSAQQPSTAATAPAPFVKGTIDINFNSHSRPGIVGVLDNYQLNLNVANSVLFHGTITDTPQVIQGHFSKGIVQNRSLGFDLVCDVVNPKNPSQIRQNVADLKGNVGIDPTGLYQYDQGSVQMNVYTSGGSSSKFTGNVQGKPLGRPDNWMDNLRKSLPQMTIARNDHGKTVRVALSCYDKLVFQNSILCEGPGHAYSPVTVLGEMVFDYDKWCWFFNNLTLTYTIYNFTTHQYETKTDRITGTIRWVQASDYATSGLSEYDFDVRFNEPPPQDNGGFGAPPPSSDDSEFFTTDNTLSALVGTIKFHDKTKPNPAKKDDYITLTSQGTVDLKGQNLTSQQTMAITKVLFFSATAPMFGD